MIRPRRSAVRCACALVAAVVAAASARTDERPAERVLFIGNSLTAANDLPALVETLARAAGSSGFECRAVTFPGFSLEDHWRQGDALRAIREGGWSTVVLQQGPSALPASRALLLDYAQRFDAEARRIGARTALYMVWPSRARDFDFDGVKESYAAAADAVGGLLLPVGEAWTEAWRLDPSLELYAADELHPSALGSYLAALVIFERLSGRSAIGLPSELVPKSPARRLVVDPPVAATLQRAAAQASAPRSR